MSVEHAAPTKQPAPALRGAAADLEKPGYGRHVCSTNVGKERPQPRQGDMSVACGCIPPAVPFGDAAVMGGDPGV